MHRLSLLTFLLIFAGCDATAVFADPRIAQREADAKAVGGACRYGMRSIEDCYELNEKASKAAVFAGWKEMDQYMRENKVEGVASTLDKSMRDSDGTNVEKSTNELKVERMSVVHGSTMEKALQDHNASN